MQNYNYQSRPSYLQANSKADGRVGQKRQAPAPGRHDSLPSSQESVRGGATRSEASTERAIAGAGQRQSGVGKFSEIYAPSPNYTAGRVNECWGVVWHHSCGGYEGTVDWCRRKQAQVSYHCVIDLNGNRTTLGTDDKVMWHAGVSSWSGRQWANRFMIGVSFTGDTNNRDLRPLEIESAMDWLKSRWEKYGWNLERMLRHADVSPGRKDDVSKKAMQQIIEAIKQTF